MPDDRSKSRFKILALPEVKQRLCDPTVSPSEEALNEAHKQLTKALSQIASQWKKPSERFPDNSKRPDKCTELDNVLDQMESLYVDRTIAKCAVYRAVEEGNLRVCLETWNEYSHIPDYRTLRLPASPDDPSGEPETVPLKNRLAGQSADTFLASSLWLWPTKKLLKANKTLKTVLETGKKSKSRGREPEYDSEKDKKLVEDWRRSGYTRYAEYEVKHGLEQGELKQALDRVRHRNDS